MPLDIAVGERLRIGATHWERRLFNGTIVTVEALEQRKQDSGGIRVLITGRTDTGREVRFHHDEIRDYHGRIRLEHGYALTIASAQGLTAERVFLYADAKPARQTIYPAATRHRERLDFYLDRRPLVLDIIARAPEDAAALEASPTTSSSPISASAGRGARLRRRRSITRYCLPSFARRALRVGKRRSAPAPPSRSTAQSPALRVRFAPPRASSATATRCARWRTRGRSGVLRRRATKRRRNALPKPNVKHRPDTKLKSSAKPRPSARLRLNAKPKLNARPRPSARPRPGKTSTPRSGLTPRPSAGATSHMASSRTATGTYALSTAKTITRSTSHSQAPHRGGGSSRQRGKTGTLMRSLISKKAGPVRPIQLFGHGHDLWKDRLAGKPGDLLDIVHIKEHCRTTTQAMAAGRAFLDGEIKARLEGKHEAQRQLNTELAPHAAALCRRFLPEGVKMNGQWRVRLVHRETEYAMNVELSGPERGSWTLETTSGHGALLDIVHKG